MSVPTCKRCGTKFPGKEICKLCGGDPNTEPTLEEKITEAEAERDAALASVAASLKQTTSQFVQINKRSAKKTRKAVSAFTAVLVAAEEEFPGFRAHARRAHRARLRSLRNTRTSGRSVKHGRQGVR